MVNVINFDMGLKESYLFIPDKVLVKTRLHVDEMSDFSIIKNIFGVPKENINCFLGDSS